MTLNTTAILIGTEKKIQLLKFHQTNNNQWSDGIVITGIEVTAEILFVFLITPKGLYAQQ